MPVLDVSLVPVFLAGTGLLSCLVGDLVNLEGGIPPPMRSRRVFVPSESGGGGVINALEPSRGTIELRDKCRVSSCTYLLPTVTFGFLTGLALIVGHMIGLYPPNT
eukprot:1178433-Prorocentrum_minimum.AAC.2